MKLSPTKKGCLSFDCSARVHGARRIRFLCRAVLVDENPSVFSRTACWFRLICLLCFARQMIALALDDGYWGRMANVAFLPAIIIFMLFIVHFGITQIVCALGPVAHMQVLCVFCVFFCMGARRRKH